MLTEEQLFAVYALNKHVLVSAGAGSGKTAALVERYVQTLLHDRQLRPANLIAVTFTHKAAAEMRTRLKERLDELIQSSDDPYEQQLLRCHRVEIDSATIGTIHSLCDSMLRAFPAQAGVDPDFQILDKLERRELMSQSAEMALLTLGTESPPVQELLSSYPINTVKEWVTKTLESRVEFADAVARLPDLSDEGMINYIHRQIVSIQRSVWERIKTSDWWCSCTSFLLNNTAMKLSPTLRTAVNTAVQAYSNLQESETGDHKLGLKDIFELLHQIAEIRFAGSPKDPLAQEVQRQAKYLRDTLRRHLENVPLDVNPEDRAATRSVRAIIDLHNHAVDLYSQQKLQSKKLDFEDQIIKAHDLLASPEQAARRYYNKRLSAILVDEFQDTNRLQSRIIDLLVGPNTRVFLIGDDKQSIYKFQGADVSVFNLQKSIFQDGDNSTRGDEQDIEEIEHMLATFKTSFRGHPELTTFLNNLFHLVLETQGTMPHYHAQYAGLTAGRTGDPEPRVDVVHFVDGGATSARLAVTTEAESVAHWIREKVDTRIATLDKSTGELRDLAYGDFAVLLQTNAQFRDFEQAFASFGLPYVCLGGSSFYSTQEVFDLENLLKFLQSPLDDHALFGVLRSPFFGFSDNMLQSLINQTRQSALTSLWESLQLACSDAEQVDSRMLHAQQVLSDLKVQAPRSNLPDVIRQALLLTGYDMVLSALPSGHQRSRNIWKFLELAADKDNGASISDFVQHLKLSRQFDEESTGAPLDPGNSIKIMTIHRAKGLEFPAVALAAMSTSATRGHGGNRLRFHREYGVSFDNSLKDEIKPGYFEVAKKIDQELDIAEKRRLFYVAASRARDYLGIFIPHNPERNDSSKKSETFGGWLTAALQSDPVAVEASPQRREFHGSYGIASYNVSFHLPSIAATPNVDDVTELEAASVRTTDGAASELALNFNDRAKILEPIPATKLDPEVPWGRRLRITLKPTDILLDGVLLGDYFHKVMEYVAATGHKPDESVLKKVAGSLNGLATDANFQTQLVLKVTQLMPLFYKSELHTLMSSAIKLIHEVPYIVLKESDTAKTKRPDLLLQDSSKKWRIVDYKTDDVVPQNTKIKKEYRDQVLSYVDDIKSICNIDASGYIYFAQTGDLQPVNQPS